MPIEVPTAQEHANLTAKVDALADQNRALAVRFQELDERVTALENGDTPTVTNPFQGSSAKRHAGESQADAYARVDANVGPLNVLRVFDEGKGYAKVAAHADSVDADIPLIVSSKRLDLTDELYARITRDGTRRTWFCYNHEPENPSKNIDPAVFRRESAEHAEKLRQLGADGDLIKSCTILMGWTFVEASGRDPEDWYVPEVDVLGVDSYYKMKSEASVPDRAINFAEYAKRKGKNWVLGEWGIASGYAEGMKRAAGIDSFGGWINDQPECEAACWWHSTGENGSYEVDDDPASAAALRQVIADGRQH